MNLITHVEHKNYAPFLFDSLSMKHLFYLKIKTDYLNFFLAICFKT